MPNEAATHCPLVQLGVGAEQSMFLEHILTLLHLPETQGVDGSLQLAVLNPVQLFGLHAPDMQTELIGSVQLELRVHASVD